MNEPKAAYPSHTYLATDSIRHALAQAVDAVGRLDDLLTDDWLSPSMRAKVMAELKLVQRGGLKLDDIDLEALETEADVLATPFLASLRTMRCVLVVAALGEQTAEELTSGLRWPLAGGRDR